MSSILQLNSFENLIFDLRGTKVMLDSDLAALYETETKKLKQQVKRNEDRFPEDFMFTLTQEERTNLIDLNPRLQNLRFSPTLPLVFTEQGVAMLSSVLNSKRAVQINIEIMRAFSRYRAIILENKELKKEIIALDGKINNAFKYLLEKIDALAPKYSDREKIGFKRKNENK